MQTSKAAAKTQCSKNRSVVVHGGHSVSMVSRHQESALRTSRHNDETGTLMMKQRPVKSSTHWQRCLQIQVRPKAQQCLPRTQNFAKPLLQHTNVRFMSSVPSAVAV